MDKYATNLYDRVSAMCRLIDTKYAPLIMNALPDNSDAAWVSEVRAQQSQVLEKGTRLIHYLTTGDKVMPATEVDTFVAEANAILQHIEDTLLRYCGLTWSKDTWMATPRFIIAKDNKMDVVDVDANRVMTKFYEMVADPDNFNHDVRLYLSYNSDTDLCHKCAGEWY